MALSTGLSSYPLDRAEMPEITLNSVCSVLVLGSPELAAGPLLSPQAVSAASSMTDARTRDNTFFMMILLFIITDAAFIFSFSIAVYPFTAPAMKPFSKYFWT